jgi:predicted small integral membrane protein
MPLIQCVVWIIALVVIVGVLVWALKSWPGLDDAVRQMGRIAIIVLFAIALLYIVLDCLGVGHPPYLK